MHIQKRVQDRVLLNQCFGNLKWKKKDSAPSVRRRLRKRLRGKKGKKEKGFFNTENSSAHWPSACSGTCIAVQREMPTWSKWHKQIPAEETLPKETSILQTPTRRANTLASRAAHSSCFANGKLPTESVAYKSKKVNAGRFAFLNHPSSVLRQ